jgi:RNA polymerase sigma-70 factor (ECF subfamily)
MINVDNIVAEILAGKKSSYRHLVQEFGPIIRAFLVSRVNEPTVAEDIAQETFIAAYENLEKFRLGEDFGKWLKGIAHNKLLMHWRTQYKRGDRLEKLKTKILQEVDKYMPKAFTQEDELITSLQKCLEELPERSKDIIKARYQEQERVKDIAGRLKTTVTAISSLLFRARKQLEMCLAKEGGTS